MNKNPTHASPHTVFSGTCVQVRKEAAIKLASCQALARAVLLLVAVLATGGCIRIEGPQSALAPAGPAAQSLFSLSWIMFWASVAILALVMALALAAALGKYRPRRLGLKFVIAGGVLFPVTVLSALLLYTYVLGDALRVPPGQGEFHIEVVGNQWWWDVYYVFPDAEDKNFRTANEIHLPVGVPVDVHLTTRDVIHSFWVPRLAGKLDLLPGHVNVLTLQADEVGVFRGHCAEFCGLQHARMAFYAVAEPMAEFEAWAERQRQPAAEPQTALAAQGRDVLLTQPCLGCHSIRGVGPHVDTGPDLTHVGSRLTIAAGTLPTSHEAFATWVTDPQALKPGAKMPAFPLPAHEREALAAYMESLQ